MVFKILTDIKYTKLRARFQFVKDLSQRQIRLSDTNSLYICKPNLEMTKRSFVYRGSLYWNSLPVHVREMANLTDFKLALDHYEATYT